MISCQGRQWFCQREILKMKKRLKNSVSGFTLAEMLVTVAIIGIIMAMLIPALNMVQKTAKNVKQKSQFNNISIALEAFRVDFGDYPESGQMGPDGLVLYNGAQKLAEAIVGLDGFGFHPKSEFRPDGQADINGDGIPVPIYEPVGGFTDLTDEEIEENRKMRKGPYLELETANAVDLRDLYDGSGGVLAEETKVLADMFGLVKHKGTGRRTGMPVLYYRADTSKPGKEYNYMDNVNIPGLGPPSRMYSPPSQTHPLVPTPSKFLDLIRNPNFTDRYYRTESFILLSAGHDGLYGTPDDVFNFDNQ